MGFYIHIISKNELISEYSFDMLATGILRYQSKKYILFTYLNDLHLYNIENKNRIVIKNCKTNQISIRWCNKYRKWFQDNYKYLVLELQDQTIDIYNVDSREKILSIESEHEILDVLYTDKNKQLIYRDNITKILQICDIKSETYVILPNQNEDEKAIIHYSECNNYVLSFDFQNNRIKIWSTTNHEVVNIIEIDDDRVKIFQSTKFSEIIICYENYTKIWDIKTGLVMKTIYDTQIKSIDCVEGKDYQLYEKINNILENIE